MNFVRKKKRGQSSKTRRTFFSEEQYRIIWRRTIHGVHVPARFQAGVRTVLPDREMWDIVDLHHRLYKTLGAAQKACEKHYRLWSNACEAPGLRAIRELFGKVPLGLPAWAMKKINPRIRVAMLCANPSDRSTLLLTSESDSSTETVGVALDAEAGDSLPSNTSTGKSPKRSRATCATLPAKGRKKRSSRNTGGSSTPTKRSCGTTKATSRRRKAPSAS